MTSLFLYNVEVMYALQLHHLSINIQSGSITQKSHTFMKLCRCMKNLGSHHPHLALPLVPELLCLHPYFDTPEPDMDDAACILLINLVWSMLWYPNVIRDLSLILNFHEFFIIQTIISLIVDSK